MKKKQQKQTIDGGFANLEVQKKMQQIAQKGQSCCHTRLFSSVEETDCGVWT